MMLVWSKTNCVWLSGMPIMSQMIPSGSGAAIVAHEVALALVDHGVDQRRGAPLDVALQAARARAA